MLGKATSLAAVDLQGGNSFQKRDCLVAEGAWQAIAMGAKLRLCVCDAKRPCPEILFPHDHSSGLFCDRGLAQKMA